MKKLKLSKLERIERGNLRLILSYSVESVCNNKWHINYLADLKNIKFSQKNRQL